jgi:predicted DNA-binding transcriptional regulator YafY
MGFADAILKDFGDARERYMEEQSKKAPRRRPRRVGFKPRYGTLYALRNKAIAVQEAALRLVQIVIIYKKITTGEVKRYVVAPYSYRYRRLRIGRRKVLYAYDMRDRHIKSFVWNNIRKVAITDRKFRPKWPVEIGVRAGQIVRQKKRQ